MAKADAPAAVAADRNPADTGNSTDDDSAAPEDFDEAAYFAAFPDVVEAIRDGLVNSAVDHYRQHGRGENRLADARYLRALARGSTLNFPAASVDRGIVCGSGRCLVMGWLDDTDQSPLGDIEVRVGTDWIGAGSGAARLRRSDVENTIGASVQRLRGFWRIVDLGRPVEACSQIEVRLQAGDERKSVTCTPEVVSDEQLRDIALEYLAGAQYFGDPRVEAFFQLDGGGARSLIDLNSVISQQISCGAYRTRIGARFPAYEASIIVCLDAKAEFLTLQSALFAQCPGFERYELIYVSNSPELADQLVKDATIASRTYGVGITLVLLPGNVGFGVASNVAAREATSERLLFVSPGVFPHAADWPKRHTELVTTLPAAQTRIFGAPLYYDDGSLMHGGLQIETDGGFSAQGGRMVHRDIIRVDHVGKGAPPDTEKYLRSRPVAGVAGAFISIDRAWFEVLGGFSPEFIFGHYEDVDLCLRSRQAGSSAWIHNIPFYHLESKGVVDSPVHRGGRLVNQWLLTAKWRDLVLAEADARSSHSGPGWA